MNDTDCLIIIYFSGNCHVPPIVRSQQWKLLRCTNKARCPACWLKMCLKAFQVPPSIRAGLTEMLPPFMRSAVKTPGCLTQANPLRIASNTSTNPPVFAITNTDNENNKIFGTLKPSKKIEEIEKIEVCVIFIIIFLFPFYLIL